MLQQSIIAPSSATAYFQVLLTPKPDGKWHFCIIYYRSLNSSSNGHEWPIPNISEMLQWLGSHKPKYFGVMDLTSGYYQAPLGAHTRKVSAFITCMGLFE